jgi:hypothetical protein
LLGDHNVCRADSQQNEKKQPAPQDESAPDCHYSRPIAMKPNPTASLRTALLCSGKPVTSIGKRAETEFLQAKITWVGESFMGPFANAGRDSAQRP